MHIDISTKNIELNNALEEFVREKVGSLDKLIGNDTGKAKVEIGKPSRHHKNGIVFSSEINLTLGGKLLRAEANHIDLRLAIIAARDELQTQIKKFKEKRTDLARRPKK